MQKEVTYKQFFDRLYYNTYNRGRRTGKDVQITAHFTIKGVNKQVARNDSSTVLSELKRMAQYYDPEKIMVIVEAGGEKKVYKQGFSIFKKQLPENDRISQTGNSDKQEFSKEIQANNNFLPEVQPNPNGFQGLGQVSVEQYITKKLDDERKDQRLLSQEKELDQKNTEIKKLEELIEKLEDEIGDNEKEKDELEGILESKKNIRYWAGLTGDILESIGLKKETLREPFAGLIAAETDDQPKQLSETTSIDQSGIIEDNPDQSKRSELIALIKDYLQTVDNETLANVFMIFSEIEKDNSLAKVILKQLKHQKQKEDANI